MPASNLSQTRPALTQIGSSAKRKSLYISNCCFPEMRAGPWRVRAASEPPRWGSTGESAACHCRPASG